MQWTPVIAGALAATALSLILVTFAAAIGLGVSSTSPTWRDASVALWLLSGLYLILQAIISFGFGAYIAGRMRRPLGAGPSDQVETRDGLHGLAVWAVAVVLGATVAAFDVTASSGGVPEPQRWLGAGYCVQRQRIALHQFRFHKLGHRNPRTCLVVENYIATAREFADGERFTDPRTHGDQGFGRSTRRQGRSCGG